MKFRNRWYKVFFQKGLIFLGAMGECEMLNTNLSQRSY